jgi:hypothetical protein
MKVVYDITQLSEAETKIKLQYYTFQSFTFVCQSSDTPKILTFTTMVHTNYILH